MQGKSRLKRIPKSRNVPGFPDGISGAELQPACKTKLRVMGAVSGGRGSRRSSRAQKVSAFDWSSQTIDARTVLLATGRKADRTAELAKLDDGLAAGLIRYCPICDGYEAQGKDIAVLGGRPRRDR